MKPVKRTNKIDNADLFTTAASEHYQKHIKTQSKQTLSFINQNIDWEKLLAPIKRVISKGKSNLSSSGRPPHDLLIIVKCFVLQSIYNLSDPRLEEEIADRRSFQLFLNLASGDSIPDETTICRYQELFARLDLDKELFSSFNKQLEARGMIVGKGTIVDATLKKTQATPHTHRDADAQFTVCRGKTHYGYKGHIGMDDQTKVIHTTEFTPANVHDSKKFDDLLLGSEKRVYADKGYANKERRIALRNAGMVPKIMHKGYRNRPLTKKQIAQNKIFAQTRNAVEKPFAFMKVVLNYTRCKYYDFKRNRFQFSMAALVYNIRRMITLTPKRA